MTAQQASWIGVDWGTTNLRAFLVDASGNVIAELDSDRGMASLKPDEFENTLVTLIAPWLSDGVTIPVFACGMVGARQGWTEAKYRPVPCRLLRMSEFTRVATNDQRIDVYILPGLSQASPADVMRGEETQIAGFLASEPNYCGTVCLPGTHTKWVEIQDGVIGAFHTFMTGELFSLLSQHSILRHSIREGDEDPEAFMQAALAAADEPGSVALELFGLRAGSLLNDPQQQRVRPRLSGMVIGHEIGIASAFWAGSPIALIGAPELTSLYAKVLVAKGADIRIVDARMATLSGLAMAARQISAAAA
ncbi:MAG: 2-dehydro-3-deoxygalactonokinase [Alphaproteobacteria bacterium]|nr:2-dehydro-3-deoxygalactonokinase [Alphaproteobacteria bacterium]